MRPKFLLIAVLLFALGGCENTDVRLATEAGLEAVTAFTLSDEAVRELAKNSAAYIDREHAIAPVDNEYAQRLARLVGRHQVEDTIAFDYKVYLDDTVNAFAMADGTIRIYSGLMKMLDDGELRFVIGHEMGHVVKQHIRWKMQLAYAASAVRKGVASQNSTLGDLARSELGGFAELFLGSRFSQMEEKVADDYGLQFLQKKDYNSGDAVSALRKLATLGAKHSFLSSHPDPGKRAERLQLQIEGKALPIEETSKSIVAQVLAFFQQLFPTVYTYLLSLINRLIS